MIINNVGIIGIGSYVPDKILTNEDIDKLNIGSNAKWASEKLGIEQRHVANSNQSISDLAYESSLRAIEDAKIDKNNIDLIILSTSSSYQNSPPNSSYLAHKLNIVKPFFDINVVCTGFLYGLQIATNLIQTKEYKNILLVTSEIYSKLTNWRNKNAFFFGDGSSATIISSKKDSWITTDLYGDSSGKDLFSCQHGSKFQMDGKGVFEFAMNVLPNTILETLKKNNLTIDNIDWLVPHQPSINLLNSLRQTLNFPTEKMIFNMKNFGNTASASIPMALDYLYKSGKLNKNDLILSISIGSGMTWAISILKF